MLTTTSTLRYQQGALLAMSLILLIILTIIAVSFGQVAKLELHSAKNYADRLYTLTVAENTLSSAEAVIQGLSSLPNDLNKTEDTFTGFYESGNAPDPFSADTWNRTGSGLNAGIRQDGDVQYFIEIVQTMMVESPSVSIGGYGEDTTPFDTTKLTVFRTVIRAPNPYNDGIVMIESFYDRLF